MGFIWVINFDTEKMMVIKETLELTTFILASEIYSFQLMDELKELNEKK